MSASNVFYSYPPNQQLVNVYFSKMLVNGNLMNEPDETKQKMSLNIVQQLSLCLFDGDACVQADFKWYYHNEYGNCYQFNSGGLVVNSSATTAQVKQTSKTGKRNGLNLVLFVGYPSDANTLAYENGAHVIITNQTTSPSSTEGIAVAAGAITNVKVSKRFSSRLPMPYNECRDDLTSPDAFDSFFYKRTLESGYAYKQKDCLNLCVQDYLIRQCNCSDPSYTKLYNVSYCRTVAGVKCLYAKQKLLYRTKANLNFFSYCPLECSSEQMDLTVSASDFPSEQLGTMFQSDPASQLRMSALGLVNTFDTVKRSYVWLNVYYDETNYELAEESPSQLAVDLMSSIGGTMGLYIGVSFLSFIEIVEAFVIVLMVSVRRAKEKLLLARKIQPDTAAATTTIS